MGDRRRHRVCAVPRVENRKKIRDGSTQVIHFHRIGRRRFKRVSELIFVEGQPRVVLGWIDFGGLRTPLFLVLDPSKLRKARFSRTYYYDEDTSDPRFEEMHALPHPPLEPNNNPR